MWSEGGSPKNERSSLTYFDRWLDHSGIWTCRIKIAQPKTESRNPTVICARNQSSKMTPKHALDVASETTPHGSWCKKEKLEKPMQPIPNINGVGIESIQYPVDPDAQATVTDFLDFTEYLPCDMVRSLTLVGNLDQIYHDTSANVHDLTTQYANRPELPIEGGPDPTALRKDISRNLDELINLRTLAHAEAIHMTENVERHFNRIKNILSKLQAIADNYPSSPEASPTASKLKSPALNRPQKLTLRLDGRRSGEIRVRKQRNFRITVPGEVLAPYEVDYPSYDEESEDSSSEDQNLQTKSNLFPQIGRSDLKHKLRITHNREIDKREKKDKKERTEKNERAPRPHRATGAMGTNAHSSVAGISASNALAQLKPPPADAKPGDKEMPWLQLNEWELAKLRKRMKKNAIWSPSDTMIARELKLLGRGLDAYQSAVQLFKDAGETPIFAEPPQLRGETVHAEGAMSVEAVRSIESQLCNRSIKINEVKMQKREEELVLAAEEAEEAARQMIASAEAMKDLFTNKPSTFLVDNHKSQELFQSEDKLAKNILDAKTSLPRRPAKITINKRRREEPDVDEQFTNGIPVEHDAEKKTRSSQKKIKIESITPAQIPLSPKKVASKITVDKPITAKSVISECNLPGLSHEVTSKSHVLSAKSPTKLLLTVVPTQNELKKQAKKDLKLIETAANSRSRRTSGAPTPITPLPPVSDTALIKRPTSSRGRKPSIEEVALNVTAPIDRPRRTSTALITSAPPESRTQGKRSKRPAPGIVTINSSGSTSVSVVGKRSGATRKKPGSKKDKKNGHESGIAQEIFDEFDDEGNLIDPDEPRYCSCNRVSFGVMIECDASNCEKEWFHLECVGLTEVPPRTTKWYCPSCRVSLGIGEKGEITARGIKK